MALSWMLDTFKWRYLFIVPVCHPTPGYFTMLYALHLHWKTCVSDARLQAHPRYVIGSHRWTTRTLFFLYIFFIWYSPVGVYMSLIVPRWFKYDRDKLWLVYTQIVPVIFEPPCIISVVIHTTLYQERLTQLLYSAFNVNPSHKPNTS
jgi:hypothetical protein